MNITKQDNINKENMQLICLWPACNNQNLKKLTAYYLDKYDAVIHDTKERYLPFTEFSQFIYRLYHSEPWMKRGKNINLNSLLRKTTWCYSKRNPITMILLSLKEPHSILSLKEDIRKQAGAGKHSIHTVENTPEALFIWDTYATASSNPELPITFYKKNRTWTLLKLYNSFRITLFRLIGHIEE